MYVYFAWPLTFHGSLECGAYVVVTEATVDGLQWGCPASVPFQRNTPPETPCSKKESTRPAWDDLFSICDCTKMCNTAAYNVTIADSSYSIKSQCFTCYIVTIVRTSYSMHQYTMDADDCCITCLNASSHTCQGLVSLGPSGSQSTVSSRSFCTKQALN